MRNEGLRPSEGVQKLERNAIEKASVGELASLWDDLSEHYFENPQRRPFATLQHVASYIPERISRQTQKRVRDAEDTPEALKAFLFLNAKNLVTVVDEFSSLSTNEDEKDEMSSCALMGLEEARHSRHHNEKVSKTVRNKVRLELSISLRQEGVPLKLRQKEFAHVKDIAEFLYAGGAKPSSTRIQEESQVLSEQLGLPADEIAQYLGTFSYSNEFDTDERYATSPTVVFDGVLNAQLRQELEKTIEVYADDESIMGVFEGEEDEEVKEKILQKARTEELHKWYSET